jgi:NitT/TauT family transport system permease protein
VRGEGKKTDRLRSAAVSFIAVAVVWEAITRFGAVPRFFLPPLTEIAVEFWRQLVVERSLYGDILVSSFRILGGFLLSVLFGVIAGVLSGLSKRAEGFLVPSITAMAPVPKVAFLPLFVVWFGIGEVSKVLVVFANNFYQVFINTFAGIKGVDERYLWAAASMGLSRWETIRFVILPGALPYIISGARITAPVAVVIVVLAEMIAARNGIGFYTYQMARDYRLVEMFVGLGVLGVMSLLFDSAVTLIGRRMTHWE